ncbi:MAG: WD40/YVTN/BNR-like repeat-containing protein, partial [Bacteroidales bacterium]
PSNPGKIFVAMWDHQRWPWSFRSSSGGSGLWLTRDGGETFTQITQGLPEEKGRMGIAIAASDPDVVYLYVESKPSAIYRSDDGGITWKKRGEKNIGNRPFYYAEIYADPQNENRVYTLFSGVNVSEDGALTFDRKTAESVHLDHHAWYIDPRNPDRMLDGNDGGMGITYDRGATWRHIENLPLGQFYHVRVDDELPYNIYGGLQDNGSWRGPSYSWHNGPLINEMYEFLLGGDGFDAMPVPGDNRYCYAQSQGGSLRRFDVTTGWSRSIRPVADGNEKLRFNWNAALAQDPFDSNTIYFGSQYVHKSTDRGETWTKISSDLTTNDPEKQKQDLSGGISPEATGAENHCTVITIAPSPVSKNIIWAGTDDGMIQVTHDGGQTWENTAPKIKDMPRNAWVSQITASAHDEEEAFVVVNDYRQGDNAPYLYRTKNLGRSWHRIIDDMDVWGYVLCFVQDPVEPGLMFAGTEYGLYVSFDGGDAWNRWTSGYPTVSTYDMAIQPREHDLIIGTFGRALWVLDDIRPLRALAANGNRLLKSSLEAFEAPEAWMASTKNLPGYYFYGDAMFRGENRQPGAMISFYALEPGKVEVDIKDDTGKTVKTTEMEAGKGFNRFTWRLDRNALPQVSYPSDQEQQDPRARYYRNFGGMVIPGNYTVTLKKESETAETMVKVNADPR